ncbi:MAG: cold shock domain-containing protein [Rubrobacter sp.]
MDTDHRNGAGTLLGRVRWFSAEKGFGLIEARDGTCVIVDHPGILSGNEPSEGQPSEGFKTLESGCDVEFELAKDARGRPLARSVRAVENAENR